MGDITYTQTYPVRKILTSITVYPTVTYLVGQLPIYCQQCPLSLRLTAPKASIIEEYYILGRGTMQYGRNLWTIQSEVQHISSERSINFCKTTRHHIPKDSTLRSYWCENLKSHNENLGENSPLMPKYGKHIHIFLDQGLQTHYLTIHQAWGETLHFYKPFLLRYKKKNREIIPSTKSKISCRDMYSHGFLFSQEGN